MRTSNKPLEAAVRSTFRSLLIAGCAWAASLGVVETAASAQIALRIGNRLVLSPGTSPADNCVRLKDALSGIDDASDENPYVLILPPAIYDCGVMSESVVVPLYVALEGSGREQTIILGTRESPPLPGGASGVVDLAPSSRLRDLTVANEADTDVSLAIVAGHDSILENVRAVSGAALVSASVYRQGVFLRIESSRLEGPGNAILGGVAGRVLVTTTQIVVAGAILGGDGDGFCLASYDIDGLPVSEQCGVV